MTSFLGQTLILLSIVTNFSILFFYRINFKNNNRFKNLISYLVRINFFIILLSFICLIFAYIISDFNNINVFYNSHTSKPLIYKISGAWGNHEGSMLLWILIMSAYTFFFSYEKNINLRIKNLTIIFQIIMTLGFLIFLAFTSNPFLVNLNNFDEGLGLNPILQDPALAIHPPLLYIGYVGYSLILSLALATLYNNDISKLVLLVFSLQYSSLLTLLYILDHISHLHLIHMILYLYHKVYHLYKAFLYIL